MECLVAWVCYLEDSAVYVVHNSYYYKVHNSYSDTGKYLEFRFVGKCLLEETSRVGVSSKGFLK